MSWSLHQIVLGFHILLAIVWVGGILFIGWGVYPAARALPFAEQRLFLRSLMQRTHWLFTCAGIGVIITGILLGTVTGPIHEWGDVWNRSYGKIWLTAIVVALFTLFWGVFVGYKQAMNVFLDDSLWQRAESGNTIPLKKAMKHTALVESVEVLGFIILIVLMLLFR